MANGFDDDVGQGSPAEGAGGPPPPTPPTPQPPGPDMAAFARSKMGPQISAPGPGNAADSMSLIMGAINMLKQAGMGLQPGTRIHGDVYQTIQRLSKHIGGAGAMGPAAGVQKTMLGDQLRRTVQNQLLSRIQGMMGGKGGPGATGGQSAVQSPPMPATPLPGS
jgi:hypothetical protein